MHINKQTHFRLARLMFVDSEQVHKHAIHIRTYILNSDILGTHTLTHQSRTRKQEDVHSYLLELTISSYTILYSSLSYPPCFTTSHSSSIFLIYLSAVSVKCSDLRFIILLMSPPNSHLILLYCIFLLCPTCSIYVFHCLTFHYFIVPLPLPLFTYLNPAPLCSTYPSTYFALL